jgi:hypothetical protein
MHLLVVALTHFLSVENLCGRSVEHALAQALPASKVAVLVLNTAAANTKVALSIAHGDIPGSPMGGTMRDVWNHADVKIEAHGMIKLDIGTHDSAFLVLEGVADELWWNVTGISV